MIDRLITWRDGLAVSFIHLALEERFYSVPSDACEFLARRLERMHVQCRSRRFCRVVQQAKAKLADSIYQSVIEVAKFFAILDNEVAILPISKVVVAQIGSTKKHARLRTSAGKRVVEDYRHENKIKKKKLSKSVCVPAND